MAFKERTNFRFLTWMVAIFLVAQMQMAVSQIPGVRVQRVKIKTVKLRGAALNYVDVGTGDPILLVHGGLGDYRTWEYQMEPFSKEYRFISYSRRYHYPNRWMGNGSDDSMTTHVNDLIGLIKTLKLGRVHLIGHSYGGFVALLATIQHPELVRDLVLCEPPLTPLVKGIPLEDSLIGKFFVSSYMPAKVSFEHGDMRNGVKAFLNGVMGTSNAFDVLPRIVQGRLLDNAKELKTEMELSLGFPRITCADLQKLQTPTLLVGGQSSPQWLRLILDEIERCLPNNKRDTIPNASHGVEFQNPDTFNKEVLSFIGKH